PNAIEALDGEGHAAGDIPPSGFEASELADLRHVTNQAVVDQMAKVRAAQKALDDTMATAYTHGPGSPSDRPTAARRTSRSRSNMELATSISGTTHGTRRRRPNDWPRINMYSTLQLKTATLSHCQYRPA
ncbi:MAG: hypothetical protein WBZ15_15470, partial [Mycobacterium sp.]